MRRTYAHTPRTYAHMQRERGGAEGVVWCVCGVVWWAAWGREQEESAPLGEESAPIRGGVRGKLEGGCVGLRAHRSAVWSVSLSASICAWIHVF